MAELRLIGRPAAPGRCAGPILMLAHPSASRRRSGDPAQETTALRAAIAGAIEALMRLADASEGDGADILAFQIAMLEDDDLTDRAIASITRGEPAHAAWRTALDGEIAGYEAAADERFRARAADLKDMRDRVLAALMGETGAQPTPQGAILLGEELTPSRFLATDWRHGGGVALTRGSATSHVAMLARARGVPMVVGLDLDLADAAAHRAALVDGEAGTVLLDPDSTALGALSSANAAQRIAQAKAQSLMARPAVTQDGERVTVLVNIADLAELEEIDHTACDGIGLVRSEFLFQGDDGLPDEATQYRAYRRIAEWAAGKPVTIRTLDAGGDKPIPGLTVEGETNPFLGLRGIRLSLTRPAVFRVQLRALARAAVHGAIEIMLPMVTVPEELAAAGVLLALEVEQLEAAGVPCRRPPLGIMVEVPAAALAIASFDADFFSIGSNDLTQYVTAASRDSATVAALNTPSNPAVLRLITEIAAHGRSRGRKVSLCGDAGGEPTLIPTLLGTGLRALSVAPTALGRTKTAIAETAIATDP